jgi:uncharacterized membrane protein
MKDRLQLMIGQALLIGLLIALILSIIGGIFYIAHHGREINHYQVFQKEPSPATSRKIWGDALTFSAYGVIQLGILILVLTQLLRVALVAFYYFKLHNFPFVWLSLFILGVLIYSLFWKL